MLEENDASTVIAAVLKMFTKEPDTTPIKLTEEHLHKEEKENHKIVTVEEEMILEVQVHTVVATVTEKKAPAKPSSGEKRTGGSW